VAISGNQGQSPVCSRIALHATRQGGHQWPSVAISGNQGQSPVRSRIALAACARDEALANRGHQRGTRNQRSSERHSERQLVAISALARARRGC